MKYYRILIPVLMLFFCSSVFAENMQVFDDIDSDGDGYITKKEARDLTAIKSDWKKADRDNDGKIDVAEFSAFEGRDMFQPADVEEPEPGAAPTMTSKPTEPKMMNK